LEKEAVCSRTSSISFGSEELIYQKIVNSTFFFQFRHGKEIDTVQVAHFDFINYPQAYRYLEQNKETAMKVIIKGTLGDKNDPCYW
jgi:hypothetical protein